MPALGLPPSCLNNPFITELEMGIHGFLLFIPRGEEGGRGCEGDKMRVHKL